MKSLIAFLLGIVAIIYGRGMAQEQYWGQPLVPTVGVIQEADCHHRASSYRRTSSSSCYLKIEYRNERHQTQHIALTDHFFSGSYQTGDSVRILYDPAHPDRGTFDSTTKRYHLPLGIILAGLLFLGYGLLGLWRTMRRD